MRREGWKNLLCENSQSKIYQKHSGRRLLLRRRVEPLKNSLSIYFPQKFTLFIAVSHTRDTDHGVGSNSTPTADIDVDDPILYKDAMKDIDKDKWLDAMNLEI